MTSRNRLLFAARMRKRRLRIRGYRKAHPIRDTFCRVASSVLKEGSIPAHTVS